MNKVLEIVQNAAAELSTAREAAQDAVEQAEGLLDALADGWDEMPGL